MSLRPILMLVVIVAACLAAHRYVEHHEASNEDAFMVLYTHLMPVPLVEVEHSESEGEATAHGLPTALVSLPLPGFLAVFDGLDGLEGAGHDPRLVMSNLQIFQIAAVLLIFLAFSGVSTYLRTGVGDPITRVLAGTCLFIRDEMAIPTLGEAAARKFLPFFLSLGFFILFMNLLGLVPGAATATASIFVTAALAFVTLLSMLGCGMVVQGPVAYWKNLVPEVPLLLWPLLFLVEVIGVFVKPFALLIRLFANMTGGHMVVLSFLGLIFFFAGVEQDVVSGMSIAAVAVPFAVFIMIIEGFVACLQAYIFTLLSIKFVGMSIHPEH
ncbi:MAG: ATP synthase F0 subunit A [Planctomycetota bacterium]|nr:MAG: ATP synthase F0 subunit A [Planctomycetota bacterium]